MRALVLLAFAAVCYAQDSSQQPNYQPGWPCTGKERSFDPLYARIAEASGGHLFLFDKSEVAGAAVMAAGDAAHSQTIIRASGKLESYKDIPVHVDPSVKSLFVVVSMQCMQTVQLYDPLRSVIIPGPGEGEDHWYRAGRMLTVLNPQPGEWILRLSGTGPFFAAVQARSTLGLHQVEFSGETERTLSFSVTPGLNNPRLVLLNAAGEPIQEVPHENDSNTSRLRASFVPSAQEFRVAIQGDEGVQRLDPRLFQAKQQQNQ